MGIDIDGKTIIGTRISELEVKRTHGCWCEFAEEHEMITVSPYFDADEDDCYMGFEVEDEKIENINNGWLKDLQEKAKKFKEITGAQAKLLSLADVW